MTGQTSKVPDRWTNVVLGLGSNLADRTGLLRAAVQAIDARSDCRVIQASKLYETPPWGKTDQPAFLNAALLIETELDPKPLLSAILDIEKDLGRARRERWGPRLIDIDILVFGSKTIDEENLKIPHPQLTRRAFALLPLVDVAPDTMLGQRSAKDWLADLDTAGLERINDADWARGTKETE